METHFAPAKRATDAELKQAVEAVGHSQILDELMQVAGGLLAVLNEERQIIAINRALADQLGVENIADILGLRPGEVVKCVHAHDLPGGCGTSEFCPTCGLAIALVTSMDNDTAVERTCALTVEKAGKEEDYFWSVRAKPFTLAGRRVVLLFLVDSTKQQEAAALERAFLHDISNVITGLVGKTQALNSTNGFSAENAADVKNLAARLANEVVVQRWLAQADESDYRCRMQPVELNDALSELVRYFQNHPDAPGRRINLTLPDQPIAVETDRSLLTRVVGNMVMNALEATDPGGEIRIWVEQESEGVAICVWNKAAISPEVAKRVFQRNFTTKDELGRGLGTYSMKLFGERFLGGRIHFTSTDSDGTTFRFHLNNVMA